MSAEIELNREFAGLSDPTALQAEIDGLHAQLDSSTSQAAVERDLAMEVHRARSLAIAESRALRLVFGVDDEDAPKDEPNVSIDDALSSAFVRKASSGKLPEGFADTVAKNLRIANHPDTGGDNQVSQDIAHSLAKLKEDSTFSIATALLKNPKNTFGDARGLRIERYRLHLALAGLNPQFDSKEEARNNAEIEIQGAEWRVRTLAAFKSFELIIGDNDAWNTFLQDIARSQQMYLINMVNRLQPTMLGLQERLAKGDPVATDALDIQTIDAVFERIWSTLGSKRDVSNPYSPPYQNWLEILLPAMKLLDPGEKPGEEYTHFEPPIQITRAAPSYGNDFGGYGQKLGGSLFDQNLKQYQESRDKYYNKY